MGVLGLAIAGDIAVELPQVFMPESIVLELNQDMTFKDSVVKDKINEEILIAYEEPFLPGFEAESVAKLQQKIL